MYMYRAGTMRQFIIASLPINIAAISLGWTGAQGFAVLCCSKKTINLFTTRVRLFYFSQTRGRMLKPDSQAKDRVNGQTRPSGGTAAFRG